METNFNFKSQICTDKNQSERLLALGLKKETANMTIHIKSDGDWYVTAEPFCEWEDDMNTLPSLEEPEQILPAWSLHRLIEIACNGQALKGDICSDIIFDEVIDCIEHEIKEGYFNKEYLV